jgi:signal transduction histidine kinase
MARAIAATLDYEGLETVVATDGEQALTLATELQPDLVLLDVQLPKRTGIEVCATLKADPVTRHIPVVMLTGSAEQTDRAAGLEAGAEDYLTKPFSPTELITLVDEVLSGRAVEPREKWPDPSTLPTDQLLVFAKELKELHAQEQMARRALERANKRLEELDEVKAAFLGVVTHELMTPFASIGLALQVVQQVSDGFRPDQHAALENLMLEVGSLHQLLNGVVKFAELVTKQREPQLGRYALENVIPWAIEPVVAQAMAREVDFRLLVPSDLPRVYIDPDLAAEAVFQMAHNAVKFNRPGGRAVIKARESDGMVVVEVWDTGAGLTPERLGLLGQPFEQSADSLRRGREGLGIGWAFVCYVAEVLGGWTRVESPGPDQGSTFSLALPVASGNQDPGA